MLTNTNILVVVLTIIIAIQHISSSQVLTLSGETDDENTLKQALYLVKLLKTDFVKSLRANDDIDPTSGEVNSTCPDEEAINSTTPQDPNITSTTPANDPRVMTLATPAPAPVSLLPSAMLPQPIPSMVPNAVVPQQLVIPQQAQYQPLPVGLPVAAVTPVPGLQNALPGNMPPAENFKYPYRFYRRRMVPDYFYYDVLMPRYRSNLEAFPGAPLAAAARIVSTVSSSKVTAEITTAADNIGAAEENRRMGGNLDPIITRTTLTENSTFTTHGANTSEISSSRTATVGLEPSISTLTQPPSDQKDSPLETQPVETISISVPTVTDVATTLHAQMVHTKREPMKRSEHSKARSKYMKRKKSKNYHHVKTSTIKERAASEDVVLSQVASELMYEFKKTKAENSSAILRNSANKNFKPKPTPKSTMKIYLEGSTRIQIPFPENNAFCHLYPQSKLCGAGI